MAGDLGGNRKLVFEQLLAVDVIRGPHSTGVAAVPRHGDLKVVKDVGVPHNVIWDKSYREATQAPLKVLIGHNRFATVGKVCPENAHPFAFDKVVGAHNGTVEMASRRKFHNHDKFDTDSESIFSNINEKGVKSTLDILNNGEKWTRNAWALVWYDKSNDTINFCRNADRTLTYAYSEDRCTLFWASERNMLDWILARNNIKVDSGNYFNVTQDMHYAWKLPKGLNDKFTGPAQVEHVAPELPPWEERFPSSTHHYNHSNHTNQGVLSFPSTNQRSKGPPKLDTKKWRPPYKRPNDPSKQLNKTQVFNMVKAGCVFCNEFDPNHFKWNDFIFPLKEDLDGRPLFLCEDCYNDDDIRESCKEMM